MYSRSEIKYAEIPTHDIKTDINMPPHKIWPNLNIISKWFVIVKQMNRMILTIVVICLLKNLIFSKKNRSSDDSLPLTQPTHVTGQYSKVINMWATEINSASNSYNCKVRIREEPGHFCNMIGIDWKRKRGFIVIPKCGSTSIRGKFYPHDNFEYNLRNENVMRLMQSHQIKVFAFLRHPVSRIFSAYNTIIARHDAFAISSGVKLYSPDYPKDNTNTTLWRDHMIRTIHRWMDVVEKFEWENSTVTWNDHIIPQAEYLKGTHIDEFGCVENLDWFLHHLGLNDSETRKNSYEHHSHMPSQKVPYEPVPLDLRKRIEAIYNEDLTLWNKFCSNNNGNSESKLMKSNRTYPMTHLEEFFRIELGIEFPLSMTYTNKKNYHDLEWWLGTYDPTNHTILKVEEKMLQGGFLREGIENVLNPEMYRPTSLLTNIRPMVFKTRTLFMVFNGSSCPIAAGSPYDVNYYCGFTDPLEVHRCMRGVDKNGTKKHQTFMWSQIDRNLLVFCEDGETSDNCLRRMKSGWANFTLWKQPRAQRENQVQAICKPDSLVACVSDRNSEYEVEECAKIQKRFPKVQLVSLDLHAEECEGISGSISRGRCFLSKAPGFQLVGIT